MIKRLLLISVVLIFALGGFAFAMYQQNSPPTVPAITSQSAESTNRPYVIKLHAKWCPICMMTKGVWSELQTAYMGKVNLVVFDLTSKDKIEASRAEAKRIGLDSFFENYGGETGAIFLLDGKSREVQASFHGNRKFAEYKTAIDGALGAAK